VDAESFNDRRKPASEGSTMGCNPMRSANERHRLVTALEQRGNFPLGSRNSAQETARDRIQRVESTQRSLSMICAPF
jgi:hypothetical protein